MKDLLSLQPGDLLEIATFQQPFKLQLGIHQLEFTNVSSIPRMTIRLKRGVVIGKISFIVIRSVFLIIQSRTNIRHTRSRRKRSISSKFSRPDLIFFAIKPTNSLSSITCDTAIDTSRSALTKRTSRRVVYNR